MRQARVLRYDRIVAAKGLTGIGTNYILKPAALTHPTNHGFYFRRTLFTAIPPTYVGTPLRRLCHATPSESAAAVNIIFRLGGGNHSLFCIGHIIDR